MGPKCLEIGHCKMNGQSSRKEITKMYQNLLSRSWPLWRSRHPLVTLSDATFGPLIPLDVTFEPRQALLGGPRPSKVVVSLKRGTKVTKTNFSTRFLAKICPIPFKSRSNEPKMTTRAPTGAQMTPTRRPGDFKNRSEIDKNWSRNVI